MGLKITNSADERPTVLLYGDIGAAFGGITSIDFREALETIPSKKEINLHINSDGGLFFEGIAMYSIIRQRKAAVHCVVDSLAASAASVVAMGCTTIAMATHAWMMIHEARSGGEGTADDFRKEAERLDEINRELVRIYMPRWKGTEKELKKALHDESWCTAEQSIELGLADTIIETMAIAAHVDPSKFGYKHVPQPLIAKAEDQPPFPRLAERESILSEILTKSEQEKCA